MLFQLVLTKLFSCLLKVDHVIKSCKEPISQGIWANIIRSGEIFWVNLIITNMMIHSTVSDRLKSPQLILHNQSWLTKFERCKQYTNGSSLLKNGGARKHTTYISTEARPSLFFINWFFRHTHSITVKNYILCVDQEKRGKSEKQKTKTT